MCTFEMKLNHPLTDEDWAKITDTNLKSSPLIRFYTPDGKEHEYVKVVRCKECIHYWKNWKDGEPDCGDEVAVCLASPKDDAFCSEGERRKDED